MEVFAAYPAHFTIILILAKLPVLMGGTHVPVPTAPLIWIFPGDVWLEFNVDQFWLKEPFNTFLNSSTEGSKTKSNAKSHIWLSLLAILTGK